MTCRGSPSQAAVRHDGNSYFAYENRKKNAFLSSTTHNKRQDGGHKNATQVRYIGYLHKYRPESSAGEPISLACCPDRAAITVSDEHLQASGFSSACAACQGYPLTNQTPPTWLRWRRNVCSCRLPRQQRKHTFQAFIPPKSSCITELRHWRRLIRLPRWLSKRCSFGRRGDSRNKGPIPLRRAIPRCCER